MVAGSGGAGAAGVAGVGGQLAGGAGQGGVGGAAAGMAGGGDAGASCPMAPAGPVVVCLPCEKKMTATVPAMTLDLPAWEIVVDLCKDGACSVELKNGGASDGVGAYVAGDICVAQVSKTKWRATGLVAEVTSSHGYSFRMRMAIGKGGDCTPADHDFTETPAKVTVAGLVNAPGGLGCYPSGDLFFMDCPSFPDEDVHTCTECLTGSCDVGYDVLQQQARKALLAVAGDTMRRQMATLFAGTCDAVTAAPVAGKACEMPLDGPDGAHGHGEVRSVGAQPRRRRAAVLVLQDRIVPIPGLHRVRHAGQRKLVGGVVGRDVDRRVGRRGENRRRRAGDRLSAELQHRQVGREADRGGVQQQHLDGVDDDADRQREQEVDEVGAGCVGLPVVPFG